MFESLRQGGRVNGMVYFASLLVSLVVHAAILCALVILPLVFFDVLHAEELVTFLIDPPPPPVPPPPPAPLMRSGGATKHIVTHGFIDPVPNRIPVGIPPADDTPPSIGIDGVIEGIRDPDRHTVDGFGLAELLNTEEPRNLPRPEPPPIRTPVPVGHLQEAKLIFKVNPVYPELARRAHISGTVVLEAVIDEEGNVATLKILSGHPLLAEAAA